MRQPRFLSPNSEVSPSVYHCVSRGVDRRFVMGTEEKEVFVRMMRQYEAFCGVRVLAYCIMGNHFHIMVEVPPKVKGAAMEIADGEFLARLKPLYSKGYYRDVAQMLKKFRADGADAAAEGLGDTVGGEVQKRAGGGRVRGAGDGGLHRDGGGEPGVCGRCFREVA